MSPRRKPVPSEDAQPPAKLVPTGARSGWCTVGQCLPSPYTNGCKGHFSSFICSCPCHDGEVPARSLLVQAAAKERFEQSQSTAEQE